MLGWCKQDQFNTIRALDIGVATRQLTVVLTPRLLRLRRLVIGEVERFPGLARTLWDTGPQRAIDAMASLFVRLERDGLIQTSDPARAASYFNWIVMSGPLNEAMLLGDDAVPDRAALRRHAREAVRIFLAAHATERESGGATPTNGR